MRTALFTILALTAATTACSEAASEPTAVETDALIASASAWTPSDLTRDLPVDEATRQTIEAGVKELHAAMLGLHERHLEVETLEGDARAAYVADLDSDVQALHARHLELWNSLDPDVREALASRFHEQMHDHDDGPLKSLHERMRRLHGDGH